MSRNSFDYINNAHSLLEISMKSFNAGNYEHEIELLERAKEEIEKAIKLAKMETKYKKETYLK
jgi:hypothetical protein